MLPFPCIMNSMQKWKCNTGNSRIWTPAPFSSASRADGITGGSQIYFHPYNEVSFKQCYILLNSSQGFPWLFFSFRHGNYSNRNPNSSVPCMMWLCWVFVTAGIQLWSNVQVQLCWGGLPHTQQDPIKLQGNLRRSEQWELQAAQTDSRAMPAPHGTGRKSIAVALNED